MAISIQGLLVLQSQNLNCQLKLQQLCFANSDSDMIYQRKVLQIQNISGHQYFKWTYVQWKGKIVTATALLHLQKTEGESPQPAATSQWRPRRSSAYNGALLTLHN